MSQKRRIQAYLSKSSYYKFEELKREKGFNNSETIEFIVRSYFCLDEMENGVSPMNTEVVQFLQKQIDELKEAVGELRAASTTAAVEIEKAEEVDDTEVVGDSDVSEKESTTERLKANGQLNIYDALGETEVSEADPGSSDPTELDLSAKNLTGQLFSALQFSYVVCRVLANGDYLYLCGDSKLREGKKFESIKQFSSTARADNTAKNWGKKFGHTYRIVNLSFVLEQQPNSRRYKLLKAWNLDRYLEDKNNFIIVSK